MADVYEQNLPSKANLTVNDYMRVVGSDNNSYKQLVSDVAKKIIENYTGSSVAGSNQSVKAALDSLNSKWILSPSNGKIRVATNDSGGYIGIRIRYDDDTYTEIIFSNNIQLRYTNDNGATFTTIWTK